MPRTRAFIDVKVSRTGGKTIEVTLDGDRTASAALSIAGLNIKDSEEIYVNGKVSKGSQSLKDGDRVVLVRNVVGGSKN